MPPADINANLPLDKAEIIAFFLENVLFGVSALLYVITIWVLVYHRKSERVNKRLVATSSVMMVLGTAHLAIDLVRILEGFVAQRDGPLGPIVYFAKLYEWSHVLKTAIFVIQTAVADVFATYRCYVVWNSIWVAGMPAISVFATLFTGIGVVVKCAILRQGEDVFASALNGWITAFFALTLATNICCTALIAVRIWLTTRNLARFSGQQTLAPIIIVVVESGAIYSAACITLLTVYLLGSNAQFPALDGMFPVISIVFNLIIVRIALGIAHGDASSARTTHLRSEVAVTCTVRSYGAHHAPRPSTKPLSVVVTQLVQEECGDLGDGTPTDGHGLTDISDEDTEARRKDRESWDAV